MSENVESLRLKHLRRFQTTLETIESKINGLTTRLNEVVKWHFVPICFLLTSCDLSIELLNNYSLEKMSGSNFAIVKKNGEFAVTPDVLKIACRKGIIVGFKVLEDGSFFPEEVFSHKAEIGYFILRTESGELQQGLSKNAYLESLNAMGLKYIEPTPIESWKREFYGLDGC